MRNREERCCGNCCWFKHEDIDGFGICYKKDMFPNSPNCADDPCEEYVGNEEATWGTDKFSMKVKDILAKLEKQSESYTKRDVDNAYIEREPDESNTEYVRKDIFIEKATSYIQQHWIWNKKMIEDFKSYMKGE